MMRKIDIRLIRLEWKRIEDEPPEYAKVVLLARYNNCNYGEGVERELKVVVGQRMYTDAAGEHWNVFEPKKHEISFGEIVYWTNLPEPPEEK